MSEEANVSGWTVDALRAYFDTRLDAQRDVLREQDAAAMRALTDLRLMLDERYATQTKALDAAFNAQQLAMQTAIASSDRAVQTAMQAEARAASKAEVAADKRFELLNELRGGVATTNELDSLAKQVAALESRLDRTEGRGAGLSAGWIYLLGAVAAVGTIVTLYLAMRGG